MDQEYPSSFCVSFFQIHLYVHSHMTCVVWLPSGEDALDRFFFFSQYTHTKRQVLKL